jgi:Ca2+-binding EF-hand superfamily protein
MAQDTDSGHRSDSTAQLPATANGNNGNNDEVATSSKPTQMTDKEKEEVYSCFTSGEKWGIISLISLASIFSSVPISNSCRLVLTIQTDFDKYLHSSDPHFGECLRRPSREDQPDLDCLPVSNSTNPGRKL